MTYMETIADLPAYYHYTSAVMVETLTTILNGELNPSIPKGVLCESQKLFENAKSALGYQNGETTSSLNTSHSLTSLNMLISLGMPEQPLNELKDVDAILTPCITRLQEYESLPLESNPPLDNQLLEIFKNIYNAHPGYGTFFRSEFSYSF